MATGGDGVGDIERDSPREERSTDELRKMILEEIAARALHQQPAPRATAVS